MRSSENEIYEFNKIDAYNKLKEAISYISGENVEQNFKQFMILCKTSALQGNSHAQYIMGIFYEEGILGLERYFESKSIDNPANIKNKQTDIPAVLCFAMCSRYFFK